MVLLCIGLVIFLGAHSLRLVADGWRQAQIARLGVPAWRALFSVASLAGLALIVVGFGEARADPVVLYAPPVALRHLNMLLTLLALILVAAGYVPRNHLKQWVGHPILAGVKTWAFGHLLATGTLGDVVLFGAFFVWAVADFAGSRRRDRAEGTAYPAGGVAGDLLAVAIGAAVWAAIAFRLHALVIGVDPLAGMGQ